MKLVIPCPFCKTLGMVELTGEYATTYWELSKQKSEVSGADMARIMGTKGPAMSNRLAMLEEHGLAISRKYGRKRLYKAKPHR